MADTFNVNASKLVSGTSKANSIQNGGWYNGNRYERRLQRDDKRRDGQRLHLRWHL